MLKTAMVLVALAGCPLEPGETRCTSIPIGNGYSTTRCKTAPQPAQVVVQQPEQPTGFWCATDSDYGACFEIAGGCEKFRMGVAEMCKTSEGCKPMSRCFQQSHAVCTATHCYVDHPSCMTMEKHQGRDGATCRTR